MVNPARWLWIPLLLTVGCADGEKNDRPPPDGRACTGAVPEHASMCPGADQGLTADTPRVIIGACDAATACAYACDGGFVLVEGECRPAGACTGAVPENATMCPGADEDLPEDMPRVVKSVCVCDTGCFTPCSYTCNDGFVLVGEACEPVSGADDIEIVDNGDGTVTVTDLQGSVVWLRDANCLETLAGVSRADPALPYLDAAAWAGGLASGACGLTDGSRPGDWRVPDDVELKLLSLDLRTLGEAARDRFQHIQTRGYWNSFSTCTGIYGIVEIASGYYADVVGDDPYNVWPVRDPQ